MIEALNSPLCTLEPECMLVYRLRSDEALLQIAPKVLEIARHFDGRRTLHEVCEAAHVSVTRGLTATMSLARLGLIYPVEERSRAQGAPGDDSAGRRVAARGDFTTLESAFFDCESAPLLDEIQRGPRSRLGRAMIKLVDVLVP
jgi:hypothetical protein